MDYKRLSQQILQYVGGEANIESATHCVTRLRLKLKDETKANTAKIEGLDGVIGVVQASGQYQIIIGQEVDGVYKAFSELFSHKKLQGEVEADHLPEKPTGIRGYLGNALDIFISCFTPLVPVIAGSGMIKVICTLLATFEILSKDDSTYQLLNMIGDGVYYFLPIMVGYTAAKRLNVDVFIGMVLGAIMIHPTLMSLAGENNVAYTSLAGLPVKIVNYSAQALPVILTVALAKYVDAFADKISPKMIKIFLRPMLTLLIVAPIMLSVIAPLGSILGDYFQAFANLMNHWGWIAVGLNAALFPLLVLTGMHNALIPLIITMFASQGFDAVLIPSGLIANIAEGGAAAAVAARAKNKATKSVAASAAISAVLGITEPALYGVNLRFKKPFYAMLLGSLISGSIAGLIGLTAYSFVSPSLLSLPIFIGENSNLVTAAICAILAFVITFVLAYAFGIDEEQHT
ncbi:PTS system, sucrose specific, IIABC components [Streptococcus varani]|uniref:PTS system, sucrose specific, IIABC components n=1 Tax=Streptococcus varani TaxID=1608583 RepID=A0A0E4H709_9STRE|nr:PTS transporter subunit EIIC [Streptococcus varani]CQR24165.1 PTS system, sucrose specific, IIABC components [Streptococcus varani]